MTDTWSDPSVTSSPPSSSVASLAETEVTPGTLHCFGDGKYSDLSIFHDGTTWQVHRMIVCRSSPILDRLFETAPTDESTMKPVISIGGKGFAASLHRALHFAYEGSFDGLNDFATTTKHDPCGSKLADSDISRYHDNISRLAAIADELLMPKLRALAVEKFEGLFPKILETSHLPNYLRTTYFLYPKDQDGGFRDRLLAACAAQLPSLRSRPEFCAFVQKDQEVGVANDLLVHRLAQEKEEKTQMLDKIAALEKAQAQQCESTAEKERLQTVAMEKLKQLLMDSNTSKQILKGMVETLKQEVDEMSSKYKTLMANEVGKLKLDLAEAQARADSPPKLTMSEAMRQKAEMELIQCRRTILELENTRFADRDLLTTIKTRELKLKVVETDLKNTAKDLRHWQSIARTLADSPLRRQNCRHCGESLDDGYWKQELKQDLYYLRCSICATRNGQPVML